MRSFARGFTLIELLVVISIIGILATIVLTSLNSARQKAKTSTASSQLEQIQTAFQIFYETYGDYPPIQPVGRDFCNWCTVSNNTYYANYPGINDPHYLQQYDMDTVTGQPYAWTTVTTQLQQYGLISPSENITVDPWGNPYVYDKNYQIQGGCTGWSPICSMGPNAAIDTNNCQPWPATPVTGGDDICVFLPND
ncbi:MAG TPA: type II secretion system protein [Candidatus Paceibacterota bacterium]|nr:type II secretion system protein [Candidatus Paceibacterota bacterium]